MILKTVKYFSILLTVLVLSQTANAKLVELSELPACPNSAKVVVPEILRGTFVDSSFDSMFEIGAAGAQKLSITHGANGESPESVLKDNVKDGMCVKSEIKKSKYPTFKFRLQITSNGAVLSRSSESYFIRYNTDKKVYESKMNTFAGGLIFWVLPAGGGGSLGMWNQVNKL